MNPHPVPTPDREFLLGSYRELGLNFRHFLHWRRIAVAGYFVTIAALAVAFRWAMSQGLILQTIALCTGALVSFFFLAIDHRNFRLILHAAEVGGRLEEQMGLGRGGYYSSYIQVSGRVTHTRILRALYVGIALCSFASAVLLWLR